MSFNTVLPLVVTCIDHHAGQTGTVDVSLEYNPFTGEWKVQRSDGDDSPTLAEKMEAAKI